MKDYNYIYSQIKNELFELERFRKAQKSNLLIGWYFVLAYTVTFVFLMIIGFLEAFIAVYGLWVLLPLVFFIDNYFSKKYKKAYKKKVIVPIINCVDEDLVYKMNGYIAQQHFEKSELYPLCTHYKGDDLITGNIKGKFKFGMSELFLKTSRFMKENGRYKNNEEATDVFRGLFIVVESPMVFKYTVIFKQKETKYFFDKDRRGINNMLKPESYPEFSDYKIYTDSEEYFKKLLILPLVKHFLSLNDVFKKIISFTLCENYIYICIESGENNFNPSINKPAYDEKEIRKYYEEFGQLYDIINKVLFLPVFHTRQPYFC